MIGQQIGNYRIDGEHARGAMGVVYLATDMRLDRPAILKLPVPELLAHARARDRFEREARAASALDHPNICTIYQVGELDLPDSQGQLFIAMAYYEGQTLAAKLAGGPLKPAEVADWVRQIAAGLQAAHRQGIIHRDIKAANIIITDDGRAKILDFGLAKLRDLPDPSSQGLVGTPAYLPPEILRGREADSRSDLFSLAVLSYEMLTGRVPFAELRGPALLNALLNRQPEPPSVHLGALQSQGHLDLDELDRVVLKGLDKEPANRWPTVEEYAHRLGLALGHPDPAQPVAMEEPPPPRIRPWIATGLVLISLLLFVFGWREMVAPPSTPSVRRTVPLTRAQGLEKSPAYSPGGESLAFASDELGNLDIWIRRIGSNRTVPLTADHEGYDDSPTFSPDGNWIAFVSDRDGGGIFLMPALGGPPRRVFSLPFLASQESPIWVPTVAFSPDGKSLAVSEINNLGGPWLVDVAKGAAQELDTPDSVIDVPLVQPTFAPDGRSLVMVAMEGLGTTVSTLWRISLEGKTAEALTSGEFLDQYPVFNPDGRRLYFVSNRGGIFDLWFLDFERGLQGSSKIAGPARPLTAGAGVGFPAISPSGRQLVYSKVSERSNVWTVPLAEQPVDFDDAAQLTFENHLIEFVHPSSDGRWLAFDSNRSGNVDLWLMAIGGGSPQRLTSDPAHDFCPRFSPDDREILFYSLRSGNRDLWVLSREDGSLRTLAPHPARDWMGQWTADGRSVIFESSRSGNRDLWMVAADGRGEPRRLTFHSAQDMYPVPSPDGRQVAFASNRNGRLEIHLLELESGEVRRLSRRGTFSVLLPFSWSEDGSEIYAQGRETGLRAPNLWAIRAADGSSRHRTSFRTTRLQLFESLSVRRQVAYFPVRERQGDLWLAELRVE